MFDKVFKIACLLLALAFLGILASAVESTEVKHRATLDAYNDCRFRGSSEQICASLLGN